MITFIHFLRQLIRQHELCFVPDTLLRDIGLSRFQVEFPGRWWVFGSNGFVAGTRFSTGQEIVP